MARVEPRTFSFEDLIDQVKKGVLRCPRFQRRFVWRSDQVTSFFDSIRLRYPVGSLLIWRTHERYQSFDRVGPIPVAMNEPQAPAEVGYLLDGHQRVSVIFGVFGLSDREAATLRGQDRHFLVYYDLDQEKFIHARNPAELHLPVRYLLTRDDQLTRWIDERRDKTKPKSADRERWDARRRRAFQLQTSFAQYRLPYLDITDADLNEAVNVFVRVNQQGSPVKEAEVFAALTWNERSFDFAGEARALLDEHPLYKNFGTEPVLRALLAALGENLYMSDWKDVLERHRDHLPTAMKEVREAFARALDFLEEQFGAASGKVVPYSMHIVLLTEFFRNHADQPTPHVIEELRKWFWATSFASGYASGGYLRFNEAIEEARQLASGKSRTLLRERLRLQPFPKRFHPKSARVRAFHLFLKAQGPRDLKTGELIPFGSLLRDGMADAKSIASGDHRVWRLASRLLIGAARTRSPIFPLVVGHVTRAYVDLVSDPTSIDILKSHLIGEEAARALLRDDIEGFLAARELDLIRAEQDFAKQYVDLPLAGEEVEEEAEIDVEDESEPDF